MSKTKPSVVLILAFAFLFGFSLSSGSDLFDEGIRADLPLGGELRVENARGTVSVQVWRERHVSVAAVTDGEMNRLSPVLIERNEHLLRVGISNAITGNARVDLKLRIPERTRAEIITTSGAVDVQGQPAELRVQTVSGDIRIDLPGQPDSRFYITTSTGTINANVCPSTENFGSRTIRCTSGNGSRNLSVTSDSGNIFLSSGSARIENRRPPALVGTEGPAAGVPARPSETPEEIGEDDVIRVDTEMVTVNVSVVDRGTNRGIVGLSKDDFRLAEDSVLQEISQFESSSAPFNLILLIDLSGSTRDVVGLIRQAALRFVDAARPSDHIAVITFAREPVVISGLTADRRLLRERISRIDTAPGDTKLYDSLDFAMNQVTKDSKQSRRTAVVVMSDGLDGTLPSVRGAGSSLSYAEVLHHIQEFDGVVYTLWLNTEYESLSPEDTQPDDFDAGFDRMKEMAEAGGGMFYRVERLEDLAGAYERVVADIGTVYSLSYRPTNKVRDGKWRSIQVAVQRPNAVARGRRGYFAN